MKIISLTVVILGLINLLSAQSSFIENDIPEPILKYLDPDFPCRPNTGDKYSDDLNYRNEMRRYAASHPAFPQYVNTGHPRKDQKAFSRSIETWHMTNPYFPQYIDTDHPEIDKPNFEKARTEWKKRHPEEYKELFEALNGDDQLLEHYLFIID